jgi:ABC-type glycerol-3-phosphate transport system substrate-binding protein
MREGKFVLISLLVFLVAFSLGAGGGQEGAAKPVEIRFAHHWAGNDPQSKVFETGLADFSANHPEIKLEVEGVGSGHYTDYRNKIQVDMASNNTPDVFLWYCGVANLEPLVKQDILLESAKYLAMSKERKKEDWDPSTWWYTEMNGVSYGLPMEGFRGCMFANRKLFEKYGLSYPNTYQELKSIAPVFNSNDIIPYLITCKGGTPGHLTYSFVCQQFDGADAALDGLKQNWNFEFPSNLKAAQAIEMWRKDKVIPEDTVSIAGWTQQQTLYNEQKAALLYHFPWTLGNFSDDAQDFTDTIDFFTMPGASVDGGEITVGGISIENVINKASWNEEGKREAIVAFVDFLNSDNLHSEMAAVGRFPGRPTIPIDETRVLKIFKKTFEYTSKQRMVSFHEFFFPNAEAQVFYRDTLDELYAGIINAEEFIEKNQKELDRLKP